MKKIKADFRDKEFFTRHFKGDIYAVGGYVRDLIRESVCDNEVDLLITHHSVEKILNKLKPFGKADLVGKSFGVIKFIIDGNVYDIALPRKDFPVDAEIRG
ncbi:hypothetical protein ACFLRM_03630, partial [Acidobacteriota bacterium]